jgi:hypothetical protein
MATAEAFKSDGDGSQEKFFRKLEGSWGWGLGGQAVNLGEKAGLSSMNNHVSYHVFSVDTSFVLHVLKEHVVQ